MMNFKKEENRDTLSVSKNSPTWCLAKKRTSESTFFMDLESSTSLGYDSDDSTCSTTPSSSMTDFNEQEIKQLDTLQARQEGKLQEGIVTRAVTGAPITSLRSILTTSSRYEKDSTLSSSTRCVRFGSLEIHEHPMEMGGAGVPGCGPAVTLGWKEQCRMVVDSVEAYEDARLSLPRKGCEMLFPKAQRIDLLLNAGYSMNQIRVCSHECEEIRRLRFRTVKRVTFGLRTKSTFRKLLVW
mmetsp:Transcript_904/g.2290  ORF Transcript_904/g.2290 Transcript_904/m.2290 type:complete len:240 (-) Transcript_904:360-1079(-)|eukprot:CAMPEP_0172372662 /NCGR_PEP_ID=MMETSP1060-20121228/48668_1 /TAXON_ID=37318 /ORGANISM="Pseudo-nitzschia pungens, Strain cf. cingulata" /LENGTH=239 /DNA_ID=CAMNT_0013098755 /DNA_START=88 /DNA_END=807 /DNA_ORIENTATION=-